MLTIIKGTLLQMLRKPMSLVWTLIFPLVMLTLGHLQFSSIESSIATRQIVVGFVEDATWKESPLARSLESLEQTNSKGASMFEAKSYPTKEEALSALYHAKVEGVFEIGPSGLPNLLLAPVSSKAHLDAFGSSLYQTDHAILQNINNAYVQSQALLDTIAQTNPQALSDPTVVMRALDLQTNSQIAQITRVSPDPFIRYYYAFLAMGVLMYASTCLHSVRRILPSHSSAGARYAASATKRSVLLLSTLIACWIAYAIWMCITVAWMYFGLSINFGGREGLCLLGLMVALFLPIALGSLTAVLPFKSVDWAGNFLVLITMVFSMFSGVFSMELATAATSACPALNYLNPASLIVNLLTSLYYYDALTPFFTYLAACLLWAVGACALAVICFKRSSYAD